MPSIPELPLRYTWHQKMEIRLVSVDVTEKEGHPMSETGVRGIDLFSHCRREHFWMDSELQNRRHPAHAATLL